MHTQQTSAGLLARLQTLSDQDAWNQFYRSYYRLILSFARQRGCDEQMANDVLQETMMACMRVLRDFRYDPGRGRFRNFLLGIVSHKVAAAMRRRARLERARHDEDAPGLGIPAEPPADLRENWDKEWERNVLRLALDRVRTRVQPGTWESFRMYVIEGRPAPDVCEALDLDRNVLYQHRARLLNMLNREADRLREEMGDK